MQFKGSSAPNEEEDQPILYQQQLYQPYQPQQHVNPTVLPVVPQHQQQVIYPQITSPLTTTSTTTSSTNPRGHSVVVVNPHSSVVINNNNKNNNNQHQLYQQQSSFCLISFREIMILFSVIYLFLSITSFILFIVFPLRIASYLLSTYSSFSANIFYLMSALSFFSIPISILSIISFIRCKLNDGYISNSMVGNRKLMKASVVFNIINCVVIGLGIFSCVVSALTIGGFGGVVTLNGIVGGFTALFVVLSVFVIYISLQIVYYWRFIQ
ncbi:hypothetical protein ABK040_015866 [Willaertia magna]